MTRRKYQSMHFLFAVPIDLSSLDERMRPITWSIDWSFMTMQYIPRSLRQITAKVNPNLSSQNPLAMPCPRRMYNPCYRCYFQISHRYNNFQNTHSILGLSMKQQYTMKRTWLFMVKAKSTMIHNMT